MQGERIASDGGVDWEAYINAISTTAIDRASAVDILGSPATENLSPPPALLSHPASPSSAQSCPGRKHHPRRIRSTASQRQANNIISGSSGQKREKNTHTSQTHLELFPLTIHLFLRESAAAAVSGPLLNTSATTTSTSPATTTSAPDLPSRPSSLNSVVNQTASNYSPYGTSRLGQSPYGGAYGGYNSYTSPYSRLGGMGSMYGGYGAGYGGMYGGMGGMGGYGGMYGGIPPGGDPNSLTNSFSQSTQATFQLIESIVGAFGGFAQMLESTYMATHSSFFGISPRLPLISMVSVAEQFGNLRNTLGSVLGIFTVLRWFRTLIAKFTGRPPPADATSLTPSAFAVFTGKGQMPATLPDGSPAPPRPSKKPFFFFLVAVFGLPYLMGKLIRTLARTQELEAKRMMIGPNGEPLPGNQQQNVIDPSKLDFCRVMYDYTPESQNTARVDLAVKKGDLVAVLSRSDPMGNPSEWWTMQGP
ncbi:peroxin 13 [Histoplasma capsulatum H143]|uniref:Peroxisomal membrane protein PEX13 n=1 Tax=Ajellomyces capsulatus (strain H143) TaxID=544712 RepID=C6HLE7_AJECH|nr:peroxin 13 [Histoplasma capsulatum H143]